MVLWLHAQPHSCQDLNLQLYCRQIKHAAEDFSKSMQLIHWTLYTNVTSFILSYMFIFFQSLLTGFCKSTSSDLKTHANKSGRSHLPVAYLVTEWATKTWSFLRKLYSSSTWTSSILAHVLIIIHFDLDRVSVYKFVILHTTSKLYIFSSCFRLTFSLRQHNSEFCMISEYVIDCKFQSNASCHL